MTAPTTAAVGSVATFAALDAAYRAATARTSLAVARALELRWTSIDPDNITGTSGAWLSDAIELLLAGQRQAQQYANLYTDQVRRLAVPDAPIWTPPPAEPPNVEQIRKSLVYTGLATTAREVSRVNAVAESASTDPAPRADSDARTAEARKKQLMEEAFARVAASAARYVTTAGHDQIYSNVESDKVATGWYRTTKAGCCHFCAMLASRGVVYKEDSFKESDPRFIGPGNQKVHDSCGCGLRPFYGSEDPPDRTQEYEDLWIDSQRKRKPDETAINAFRRIYGASPLSQPASPV